MQVNKINNNTMTNSQKPTKKSRSTKRRARRKYNQKLAKQKAQKAELDMAVVPDINIDADIFEDFYFADAKALNFTNSPFESDNSSIDLQTFNKNEEDEMCDGDLVLDDEAQSLIKELVEYSMSNKEAVDITVEALSGDREIGTADDGFQFVNEYSAPNLSQEEIYTNNQAVYEQDEMKFVQIPIPVYEASPDAESHCASLSPATSTTPRMLFDNSFQSRCSVPMQQQNNWAVPYYNEPIPEPQQVQQPHTPNFDAMDIYDIIHMRMTVEDLVQNHLFERFAFSKGGCRYLQDLLANLQTEELHECITMLFDYFLRERVDLLQMSEDIYGNYFVQQLCENGNEVHHELMLNYFVFGYITRLSLSQCGCRVVQKLMGALQIKKQMEQLVDCMQEQIESCADEQFFKSLLIDQNAAHVCQAIVESGLEYEQIAFIVEELNANFVYYSEDAYACRIIQSVVAKYGDRFDLDQLFFSNNHLELARTKYGNYVIQCLIAKNEWYSTMPVFARFRNALIKDVFNADNILYLSKCKHGSHMLETCLRSCKSEDIDVFIAAISAKRAFVLKEMMRHKFANYVPKTLMSRCVRKQKQRLAMSVHENINFIRHQFEYCSEFINACQHIKYSMDGGYRYYY